MKKLMTFVLSATLSIAATQAAELPETLEPAAMSNLVATVKAKAEACDPKDEVPCLTVTAKIRHFLDEVDNAELSSTNSVEVRKVLIKLRRSLTDVKEKVEDAVEYKETRIEQISANPVPEGSPDYNVSFAEARGMVVRQFKRDLIGLSRVQKAIKPLDDRLSAKIKALEH